MTPISINDPQLLDKLTSAMRGADQAFEKVGGGTRHYIRDVFLPLIESQGICFCMNAPLESSGYGESKYISEKPLHKYTDHGVQNLQTNKQKTLADYFEPKQNTEGAVMREQIKAFPPVVFGIGTAVEAAELHGRKVARQGWNGKDMYVYYVPAGNWPAVTNVAKKSFGETVPYNHYLAIKNVDGTVSTWAPSCSDALAKDWYIVE